MAALVINNLELRNGGANIQSRRRRVTEAAYVLLCEALRDLIDGIWLSHTVQIWLCCAAIVVRFDMRHKVLEDLTELCKQTAVMGQLMFLSYNS